MKYGRSWNIYRNRPYISIYIHTHANMYVRKKESLRKLRAISMRLRAGLQNREDTAIRVKGAIK